MYIKKFMELLEKVDMILTLSNISKFPILLNSFKSFEILNQQINSTFFTIRSLRETTRLKIENKAVAFHSISKKARRSYKLKILLENYEMMRDFKFVSQNLNEIKIDNFDLFPNKIENLSNFQFNRNCLIHLIITNKVDKLISSAFTRVKEIVLESFCMVIYSPFDKKYIKFDRNDVIIKIATTFDFITKKENYQFENIAKKNMELYKKYNDNLKENINDKITQKNVLKSFFYFIKINLKIFENFHIFFFSCLNVMVELNKNNLGIILEQPYEIFLKNTAILINNILREFVIHLKEFYEEIRSSLMNENILKIFIQTHQSICYFLSDLFVTKFNPNFHFLYLNTSSKKKIDNLFDSMKQRISIEHIEDFLTKIESKLMEELCLKKSENFKNSLDSLFLEKSLLVREKFKVVKLFEKLDISIEEVGEEIFESNSFLLLILQINEFKSFVEISSEFIKIIGEYILLTIEEFFFKIEKIIETEDSFQNLNEILIQLMLVQELIKKMILDKTLKNFEDYSLVQKNCTQLFNFIKKQNNGLLQRYSGK